ncbi:hypothetical protein [Paenibacillus donghaensis]|uniref:hypothetical protein n=1 Tax=Paenibacillus donghaensis TaxID=414771 RepID=UPI0031843901
MAGNPLSVIVEAMQANHLASIRDTTSLLDLEAMQQIWLQNVWPMTGCWKRMVP